LVAHVTKLVVNLISDEVLIIGVFWHSSIEGENLLIFYMPFFGITNVEGFEN
jgi:hypothetical protein